MRNICVKNLKKLYEARNSIPDQKPTSKGYSFPYYPAKTRTKRVVGTVNNTVTYSFCGTPNGIRRVQAELAVSFSTPNGAMSESNSLDQLSVS